MKKIIRKYKKYGSEVNIECSLTCSQIEYLENNIHKSSVENIIKYRNPNIDDLYHIVKTCLHLGSVVSLEKCILMYGEELGKQKYDKLNSLKAITLENLVSKYGEDEGTRRFDEYCKKQAYTNSFEYKNKKHGWTKTKFDEFNKSRAVTLENLVSKYGEDEGTRRFDEYCKKQAYTNTEEYLGKSKYLEINSKKALTLENFIRKYGDDGKIKYEEYVRKSKSPYSKASQRLFSKLIRSEPFTHKKCYYAENGGEYGILDNNTYKKYDFVCPELNFAIEYHGDHYHGNPKLYHPNECLRGRGQTKVKAKERWEEDDYKLKLILEKRNIECITIWEYDYTKDPNKTIERILKHVRTKI